MDGGGIGYHFYIRTDGTIIGEDQKMQWELMGKKNNKGILGVGY